jgi:hypothetical protein
MPRFTWLTLLLVIFQPFQATGFSKAASCLIAEMILQILSAYHMITAVDYGREHSFYSHGMARLETSSSAQWLYAGALMWLLIIVMTLVLLMQATRGVKTSTTGAGIRGLKSQTSKKTMRSLIEELMAEFNTFLIWLEKSLLHSWFDKSWDLEGSISTNSERQTHTVYGTLPCSVSNNRTSEKGMVRLFLIAIASMILLWIAQWLFWAGFIGLSMEEYVLVHPLTEVNLANCTKVLPP